MGTKITIIGAGSVGSTIANDLVAMNIATEILLIDINEQKAFGEAMDIYQGTGFTSPAIVRSGHYEDAVGSSIVIITSGLARKPGHTQYCGIRPGCDLYHRLQSGGYYDLRVPPALRHPG